MRVEKVELSAEQRELLGLDAGESIRLLDARRRTILLERIGPPESTAFPWDRDLALSADVASFALADILNLLNSSNKSGFLHFEDGDHEKSVYFHRGEVVFASSNQTFDRLGNCLLRAGLITLEQFGEAKNAYRPPGHFGRILVERAFLTPRELWNGVKVQIEEIVRSLFSYDVGTVLFWEGEVRPDNVVRLSLPTRRLIAEGLRRRDELIKFLAVLEDPQVRLGPVPAGEANLSGSERVVFDVLSEASSFADVCRKAGVEPLAGARTIRHLRLLGAITIARAPKSEAALVEEEVQKSGGDAVRACIGEYLELMAELVAPIVAVESSQGISERLGRVVEEAAATYPELFAGLCVGPGASIDPEDLIARALRFPGERDREVRLALGELVSYLEFEILNHPKIPAPEEFLDDLSALRANL
jgi:hypothetical protein